MLKALLISTYELGRQPFGLASPAAWLRSRGAHVVCLDLSREPLREDAVAEADLIAFYVPMHAATRLAIEYLEPVQQINPTAHFCFYGLYAPANEVYLRSLGVQTILGGEFEQGVADLAARLDAGISTVAHDERVISLARLKFTTPDRNGLVSLDRYARLLLPDGDRRVAGYTEASRGCKHLCRHCPIVPVYNGIFRVVEAEVVLEDIRRQVAAGAQHITFGDPDFFNGIGHAMPIVERLHQQFPQLTYDVTIKIEHLLKHSRHLRTLRDTGCLFVTSAVESTDNETLEKLQKHHTRSDFLEVVRRFPRAGLTLQPTFVPFTPWTTLGNYCDLLQILRENQLVENVAPIQLSIRLLIPGGSRLLELPEIRSLVGPYDDAALVYPWRHSDARVDELCRTIQKIVGVSEKAGQSRSHIFAQIEKAALRAAGRPLPISSILPILTSRSAIPYLDEPWYC